MTPRAQVGYLLTLGGSFLGLLSEGGWHQVACIVVAFIGIILLIKEGQK